MNLPIANITAASRAPYDVIEPLARDHDHRPDDAWLAEQLANPRSEFLPIWKLQNLASGDPLCAVRLGVADVTEWLSDSSAITYLGQQNEHALFSLELPADAQEPLTIHGSWMNMRNFGELLGSDDWSVLAYARGLAYWHERQRYCGVCGSPTQRAFGGHVMRCTNVSCATEHYPRTDPAIIVLVMSGERALLGRQPSWAPGRYSTLAGFMEPGESVEQAVAREVHEEAGIRLGEVRYFGSQAFPFPASLMLGYHAEAVSEDIQRHDNELDDARWFTREELRTELDAGTVSLPPRYAISHRLISAWFNYSPVRGEL